MASSHIGAPSPEARRALSFGRLGVATQVILALVLSGFSIFRAEPGFLPRGLVVIVAFSLPAIQALIGLRAMRASIVLAAALTVTVGSFVAFSAVTVVFLLPAAMLAASALTLGTAPEARDRDGRKVRRAAVAALTVPLLLGAGAAGLLVTDAGCWTVYRTASGTRIEEAPYSTGEMTLPTDAESAGCTTGLISGRGVGLMVLLGGLALALAAWAAGSGRQTSDRRGMDGTPEVTSSASG